MDSESSEKNGAKVHEEKPVDEAGPAEIDSGSVECLWGSCEEVFSSRVELASHVCDHLIPESGHMCKWRDCKVGPTTVARRNTSRLTCPYHLPCPGR